MFALVVERDPERALALARGDVARQREPLDLLVFAAGGARERPARGDRGSAPPQGRRSACTIGASMRLL